MRKENQIHQLSRRQLLKLGVGMAGATAAGVALPKALLKPSKVAAQTATPMGVYRHFAATDGWA